VLKRVFHVANSSKVTEKESRIYDEADAEEWQPWMSDLGSNSELKSCKMSQLSSKIQLKAGLNFVVRLDFG